MSQQRIQIDGVTVKQPDTFDWSFETTSTQDSVRTMSGHVYITPLFTVESFAVVFSRLTPAECSSILNKIVQRPGKAYFTLYYFSPYYGQWRTGTFYVGTGSLKVKTLKEGYETIQSISCNFVGKEKLV